ncbi:glutathione degradosome [Macrolepiota fuliginosa MF-IS2]|uniref:Glutathione degradosome n=1 Tax=Macrolepiota fuliginosa MF-IS2 TaxID=1400762 RepID=A0A9P6CAA8_9AGAR|nr:glutathione degradosome [Macrolepiota fuliginosa MF-IS2]
MASALAPPPVPHPSLSRNLQSGFSTPLLIHSLQESKSSVLSLAATDDYIFSGSQNRDILVWDKKTFTHKDTLRGHTGSVLALEYAREKAWLFSSGADSTIRVWCTKTLTALYVVDPYLENGAGDLFSLAWSPTLQTIFVGCKNTSLQWFNFRHTISPTGSSSSLQDTLISGCTSPNLAGLRKAHKFFDSYPQHERKPADIHARNGSAHQGRDSPDSDQCSDVPVPQAFFSIPASNVIDPAHWGYIHCMAIIDDENGVRLATGSGDEYVKLWNCSGQVPSLIHEFYCGQGAILSLVSRGETIAAGCQDGYVKVLDLETKTSVRTIIVQEGVDILSLSIFNGDLYTCSANGCVKRWSASFDCTASWKAHDGIALSSIITKRNGHGVCLVTGGSDSNIKVWEVTAAKNKQEPPVKDVYTGQPALDDPITETLIYALSKFVAIPSVSSQPAHKEDCRQAAIWLKKCLAQLGAQATLLPTGEGNNPIVFGTFEGTKGEKPRPRILFYGHYDIIPAPPEGWSSDPFTLTGRNGYLYGRGVTDDKGPITAVACAAADLLARRALGVDLVFLIEGEEEVGSVGFGETVRRHKDVIGHIDEILVSNSTWIAEDRPCLTYGLRGVVHCNLIISNKMPDLHSGIEGGAIVEPMVDMVKLLATLTDRHGHIQIPSFYDKVRAPTEEEEELYKLLSEVTQKSASLLRSRWREPSLTMHNIEISGPKNPTVIPSTVKAQISLRIVPDQDLDTIVHSLVDYLKTTFDEFGTPNKLQIDVEHTADWWLGELDDPYFKALENAVKEEWGVEPLRIREGGSIPSVPWLEKEFKCHALHLPMGQSSDQAHLPNERISLVNLQKGKAVVENFLLAIANEKFASGAS